MIDVQTLTTAFLYLDSPSCRTLRGSAFLRARTPGEQTQPTFALVVRCEKRPWTPALPATRRTLCASGRWSGNKWSHHGFDPHTMAETRRLMCVGVWANYRPSVTANRGTSGN